MVLAVDKEDTDKAISQIRMAGEEAYVIGEIIEGEKGIDIL